MTDDTQTPDNSERAQRDRVLRRIKKMLAMADDTRGNPNEIAAFAAQAASLMRRYNIEHSEVLAAEIRSGVDIVCEDIAPPNYDKRVPYWYNVLGTIVGRTMCCQTRLLWVRVDGKSKLSLKLFGYRPDIEVSQWLFSYLIGQVQKLAEQHWKVYMSELQLAGRAIYPNTRRKWKDQFREGVVRGITDRIEQVYGKAAEDTDAAAEKSSGSRNGSGALVVLREVKEQAVRNAFPLQEFTYSTPDRRHVVVREAYWIGSASAKQVRVERVIESDQTGEVEDADYRAYCDAQRAAGLEPLPYDSWLTHPTARIGFTPA